VIVIIENAADNSLQIVKEADDPDLFEHMQSLREAILDFYVGLI